MLCMFLDKVTQGRAECVTLELRKQTTDGKRDFFLFRFAKAMGKDNMRHEKERRFQKGTLENFKGGVAWNRERETTKQYEKGI